MPPPNKYVRVADPQYINRPVTSPNHVPPVGAEAGDTAMKYHFTMGELSPGYDKVLEAVQRGNARSIENLIATEEKNKNDQVRVALLEDIAKQSKGKPLAPELREMVMGLTTEELQDPAYLSSKAFADRVMTLPYQKHDFQREYPDFDAQEEYHAVADSARDFIAWQDTVDKAYKGLERDWNSRGIFNKAKNYAEQWLVPGLSQYRLRNNIDNPRGGFMLGNNLRSQIEALSSLPISRRIPEFIKAVNYLQDVNPLEAFEFVQAAKGFTDGMQTWQNISTGLEIATTLPVGKALKVGKTLIKGVEAGQPSHLVEAAVKEVSRSQSEIDAVIKASREKSGKKPHTPAPKAPKASKGEPKEILEVDPHTGASRMVPNPKYKPEESVVNPLPENKLPKEDQVKSDSLTYFSKQPWFAEAKAQAEARNTQNARRKDFLKAKTVSETAEIAHAVRPDNPNKVSDALAASGRMKEAIHLKAQKIDALEAVAKTPDAPSTPKQHAEVESLLPEFVSPKAAAEVPNVGTLTNVPAVRWRETLKGVQAKLEQIVKDSGGLVSRFSTPEMLEEGFRAAQRDFERLFPKAKDAILSVRWNKPEDSHANLASITSVFGKANGELFANPSHAHKFAKNYYNLAPDGYHVRSYGKEWAIEVDVHVDETKIFDHVLDTGDKTPSGFFNTFLGFFRTSDDLINKNWGKQRKRITHAYSKLQSEVREVAESIAAVKRSGRMTKFTRVLDHAKDVKRIIQNRDGSVRHTVGEEYNANQFEEVYLRLNKVRPTEAEVFAYEVYKSLLRFDYVIRNLDLLRDKARLGIREFSFQTVAADETGKTSKTWVKNFDGRLVDDLPFNDSERTTLAIYSDSDGAVHPYPIREMSANNRATVERLKGEGYQLIQIANPDQKPLKTILGTDLPVHFVMVKTPRSRTLSSVQLPYMPGGHRISAGQVYIKVPKITRPKWPQVDKDGKPVLKEADEWVYEGDTTVYGVHSVAKAKEMLGNLRKAKDLFLAGKKDEFLEFVEGNVPVQDAKAFWAQFADGTIPTNTDFYVVRHAEGVNDLPEFKEHVNRNFKNFVDTIDSKFNLYRQINKKFAGQRDPSLYSWRTDGYDEGRPVIEFQEARYIDSLQTMQTALSSLMRNRVFSDHIISATEQWVNEFAGLMKTPIEALRANPIHFVHNPEWIDKPSQGHLVAAAKNSRRALIQLLGTRSEIKNNVDWFKMKIVDQAYKSLGDKASEKIADHLLPSVQDPVAFMRGAAFHMKLGLFNPIQIWTQAQTLFHMTAISGNPIMSGGAMMRAAKFQLLQMTENPKIVKAMAGGDPEFLESYDLLRKSGLWHVEGEHGWKNDVLDPKIFQSKMGRFLDKGTLFFKGTERFVRLASWDLAYREFRSLNPKKLIGPRELEQIMARQDTLSLNMTNASAAAIQRGVFSLSTQFFGYQMRMLDQLLGKRLSRSEKTRVLALYSALYGVPIGGTVGLASPWFGDIKETAESEYGIKTDEGMWQALFQGGLSFLTEAITGDEYNPGKRYGPGGFELIKTLVDEGPGEDTMLALLGASTSIMGDAVRWSLPALTGIWSQIWDDEALPLENQDFIDAFRSISSVNNGVKGYLAYYYQRYETRDGKKISDASETDAVMTTFFGLTPSHIETMYQQMEELREDNAAKNEIKSSYIKTIRRALRSENRLDREVLLRKAKIYLKSGSQNEREAMRWYREAIQGEEELILSIDDDYRKRLLKQ